MAERAVIEIWQSRDHHYPLSLVVRDADVDLLKGVVAEALDHAQPSWARVGLATQIIVGYLYDAAYPELLVGTHRDGADPIIIDFISRTVYHRGEDRSFRKWVTRYV